jgi:uncharacterized membrane protein
MALLWAEAAKRDGRKWFLRASTAGTAAALILAVLRRATALINRSFVNAWTLSFALILGILYIALYWGFLKKNRLHGRLLGCAAAALAGFLLFYALPTIFLYPAEFLLAGESPFSTDFLFKCIGYGAGLLAVFLTALAVFKAATTLPDRVLGVFLTAGLGINLCYQFSMILQFLFARRIIPMVRFLFQFVVVAVNYNVVFLYTLMGVTLALALLQFVRTLVSKAPYNNPAERRKLRAGRRRQRRWCLTVIAGYAVAFFSLTALKAYTERAVVLSPAEPMTLAGEEILIPIGQVEDGHLHRFVYEASDNTGVRFIVIKKNDVAYGVGLDACDICGPTGYYERKNEVICRLCDVVMNISTIGFMGGCNPVPLAYALRNGNMVIETINLENEKTRFHE